MSDHLGYCHEAECHGGLVPRGGDPDKYHCQDCDAVHRICRSCMNVALHGNEYPQETGGECIAELPSLAFCFDCHETNSHKGLLTEQQLRSGTKF